MRCTAYPSRKTPSRGFAVTNSGTFHTHSAVNGCTVSTPLSSPSQCAHRRRVGRTPDSDATVPLPCRLVVTQARRIRIQNSTPRSRLSHTLYANQILTDVIIRLEERIETLRVEGTAFPCCITRSSTEIPRRFTRSSSVAPNTSSQRSESLSLNLD
jgi:hypothetical protein